MSGSASHSRPRPASGRAVGSAPGAPDGPADGTADRLTDAPVLSGPYCGHCGEQVDSGAHAGCSASLSLEPPRFCASCRRRMVVQVVPRGWTARCSRHGEATSYA